MKSIIDARILDCFRRLILFTLDYTQILKSDLKLFHSYFL